MKRKKVTLYSAMQSWSNSLKRKADFKDLRTGFKKYIFPAIDPDFTPETYKTKEFRAYLEKFPVQDIPWTLLLFIFDQQFEAAVAEGTASPSTKGNYRSALGRFKDHVQEQAWYTELFPQPIPDCTPPFVTAAFSRQPKQSLHQGHYSVRKEQFPVELQQVLDKWKNTCLKSEATDSQETEVPSPTKELSSEERRQQREERRRQREQFVSHFDRPTLSQFGLATYKNYSKLTERFVGWLHHIEGYPLEKITIQDLIDLIFVEDFCEWLVKARGSAYSEPVNWLDVAVSLVKFLNYEKSRCKDWSDIELVVQLKNMRSYYQRLYTAQKPQRDAKRWLERYLSHEQARKVVYYLYQRCSERRHDGSRRHLRTVVEDWIVYLIVKLLVYVPVRQGELRHLIFGKTLIRVVDRNGIERYAVKTKNHKNYNKTGIPRFYPLPKILTADLDHWLNEIRPLALAAPQTPETWLAFRGKSLAHLERRQQSLEKALRGEFPEGIRNRDNYIFNLRRQLHSMQSCQDNRLQALANAEKCEHVFFSLGGNQVNNFATFYEDNRSGCVTSLVKGGVARASKALFGEARPLNPHGFRNIGARQVRVAGNNPEAFSMLIGHTLEIDDQYAAQVTTDYELIGDFVDNWWEPNL